MDYNKPKYNKYISLEGDFINSRKARRKRTEDKNERINSFSFLQKIHRKMEEMSCNSQVEEKEAQIGYTQ